MKILGILNITSDSFSDGGKYLEPGAAIFHARAWPRAAPMSSISARRLPIPTRSRLRRTSRSRAWPRCSGAEGKGPSAFHRQLSRPTCNAGRWRRAIDYLNDIHGFPDAALYPELAKSDAKLIVMHMVQERGVAVRTEVPSSEIFDRVTRFFDARVWRR